MLMKVRACWPRVSWKGGQDGGEGAGGQMGDGEGVVFENMPWQTVRPCAQALLPLAAPACWAPLPWEPRSPAGTAFPQALRRAPCALRRAPSALHQPASPGPQSKQLEKAKMAQQEAEVRILALKVKKQKEKQAKRQAEWEAMMAVRTA